MPRVLSIFALIGFLVLSFSAAGIGALLFPGGPGDWYRELQKPQGTPPSWVFGPVWSMLYTLMAVAAWRVWRRRRVPISPKPRPPLDRPLLLFFTQLALNAMWTPVFFGWQQPAWAVLVIILLLAAIMTTLLAFRRVDGIAVMLLIPYLAWVSYATYLNLGFWLLN